MVERRDLHVLPGGRSGSAVDPDVADADLAVDVSRRYEDPYAFPYSGSRPDLRTEGGQSGLAPGSRGWPRLRLLLPPPDGDEGHDAAGESRASRSGRHRRVLQPSPPGLQARAGRQARALQAAQLLSYAGDQLARVAIAVLVYGQTRSAFLTAALYALTYLPPLLGGSAVSRLTGRLGPRTVAIGVDVARAAMVAAMALPGTHLISLCALVITTTLLGAPFSAARSALAHDRAAGTTGRTGTTATTGRTGSTGADPGVRAIGYQAGQMIGFLAGAGLVVILQPRRTLLIDALTFLASACILAIFVRSRPTQPSSTSSAGSITAGAAIVAGSSKLRTLVLLGWLAGFYVVPECLAVPYARSLGGGILVVGLLMAAMPAGAALGALALTRLVSPPSRMKPMVGLALLSCVPLIFCAFRPPLWAVLGLLALAGIGSCYQLAAFTAFIRVLAAQAQADAARGSDTSAHGTPSGHPAEGRDTGGGPGASALAFAQAGLLASQCLGFVIAGAAAQLLGAPAAVALAGLGGMAAATALARSWGRAGPAELGGGTGTDYPF